MTIQSPPATAGFYTVDNPDFLALNPGQQDTVQKVFQFLFSDEKEFMISGPAGTGKTHLMKFIREHTLRGYAQACTLLNVPAIDYEIVLTATTNKAAEVLAASTGSPTSTIHTFLGLKVVDNYTSGKSEITKTQAWTVHCHQLIFVDEASMINRELHELILKGTDKTCKIIYLGDHCQMAPVFEAISPVYASPKRLAKLTQPMRNAGQPALMALCNQLRQTVETLRFQPIQEVPGVIDYVDDTQAQAFIDQTFAREDVPARILAFSNARVQQYNQHIRSLRGYADTFAPGEILVNNRAIQINALGRMLPVEKEVIVTEVDPDLETISPDRADPTATFDTYRVTFRELGGSSSFTMKVPVNRDIVDQMIKHYARLKKWDLHFWLRNTFPDLRQRDAATVYKAQGSTYETVFLDLGNIGSCKHNDQLARMLYVGASRPTTSLVLYGQLPKRLFP